MASRHGDPLLVKPIWDVDREILLINFFQAYRFLWDSSHGEYFCKELRNMRLRELRQTLGRDRNGNSFIENDIRSKWKNLRTTYGRELKRMEQARMLGWERGNSHWYHFARLSFLRDSIKPRINDEVGKNQENHDGLNPSQVQNHSLLDDLEHDVIPMEEITREIGPDGRLAPISSGQLNKGFYVLPSSGSKWKKHQNKLRNGDCSRANLPQKTAEIAKRNITLESDPETLFGLHVACSLRRMTPYGREMAKLDIQRLFLQYAFRNQSNQKDERQTQQSGSGSSRSS
uniref:MADF domain-containing protein n=1 Tax=Eptatretus burgeri TaxID=7764 RepID=A0A8C4R161_EPTBU